MTLSYLTSDTRQSGGIWWPRRRQCNVYENACFYRGCQNINYSSLLYVRYTKLWTAFTGNVPVLALLLVFQIILVKSRIINCNISYCSTFTYAALNSGSKHPRLFHVFFVPDQKNMLDFLWSMLPIVSAMHHRIPVMRRGSQCPLRSKMTSPKTGNEHSIDVNNSLISNTVVM